MRRTTLVSILAILTHVGCATTVRPIIARGLAPREVGKTHADVHIELHDGATYDLKTAVVLHDTLRGTTADGQSVTLSASDIRYAWYMETRRDLQLAFLAPLAVIGARTLPALLALAILAL